MNAIMISRQALAFVALCLFFSLFLSCKSGKGEVPLAEVTETSGLVADFAAEPSDADTVMTPLEDAVESAAVRFAPAFAEIETGQAAEDSRRSIAVHLNRHELRLSMTQRAALVAAIAADLNETELKGVVWSSSDERVARVGADGSVTPISPGKAVVTAASVADPSACSSCFVEVVPVISFMRIGMEEMEIRVGQSVPISAQVGSIPNTPEYQTLVWSTSDPAVASVSSSGVVNGVMPGRAVIKAQSVTDSSFSAACAVTVHPFVESITLSDVSLELKPGISYALATAVRTVPDLPEYGLVRWSTSDSSIAIVTQSGVVLPVSSGDAVITATSLFDESVSASCQVSVSPNAMGLVLDRSSISIKVGNHDMLTAYSSVAPRAPESEALAWVSSDASILDVDDRGNLLPLRPGKAFVTASFLSDLGVSASCEVEVLPTVLSVDIPGGALILSAGESASLRSRVASVPDSSEFKEVEWISENPHVASVDDQGQVTGIFPGQTRIVAVSRSDRDMSDMCLVTVRPLVKSVALDHESIEILMGEPVRLRAYVSVAPDSRAYGECLWSSSNGKVLETDGDGTLHPIMPGTAVVTASSATDPSVSASCSVTVLPRVVAVLLSGTIVADKRETVAIPVDIACIPDSGAYKGADLISSDESVVRIDGLGRLECLSEGVAVVTAVSKTDPSKSASCVVVVRDPESYDVNMVQIGGNEDMPVRFGSVPSIRPFWISKYEITRDVFRRMMGYDPSDPAGRFMPENPVERISWIEAVRFCNRLSDQVGYSRCYLIGSDGSSVSFDPAASGFRLPTRAEWEFAAKGGQPFAYPGSNSPAEVAWYKANSAAGSSRVGLKAPNGYGLYDIAGNVSEWCWDGAEDGHFHMGGNWLSDSSYCLLDTASDPPFSSRAASGIGLRVARSVR